MTLLPLRARSLSYLYLSNSLKCGARVIRAQLIGLTRRMLGGPRNNTADLEIRETQIFAPQVIRRSVWLLEKDR